MSNETAPTRQRVATDSALESLGDEIRRTAARADRESRVEALRHRTAVDSQRTAEAAPARQARRKRQLAVLLAAFVLVTALNLTGYGFLRMPRAPAFTEETLDLYLREELMFEVENIEFFLLEHGRVPTSLEEMGYPEINDLTYRQLGPNDYRLTLSDSGKKLTYETGMDPRQVFGDSFDD